MTSVTAELLVVRKRSSTWILLGIWSALAVLFAYVIPYVEYLNGSGPGPRSLGQLLPAQLAGNLVEGFPFFGGVIALMLGVLGLGSEYGWVDPEDALHPARREAPRVRRQAARARRRPRPVRAVGLRARRRCELRDRAPRGCRCRVAFGLARRPRHGRGLAHPRRLGVTRAPAGGSLAGNFARDRRRHPVRARDRGTDQRLRGCGQLPRAGHRVLPAGERVFARQRTRSLRLRGGGQRPRRFQRAVRRHGPGSARPCRVHGGFPYALGTPPPPAGRDLAHHAIGQWPSPGVAL